MIDIEYGVIHLKLKEMMQKQNISINKLAFRAEMQRTQLKAYINDDIQRLDRYVLARLCYALDCSLEELVEYIPPSQTREYSETTEKSGEHPLS